MSKYGQKRPENIHNQSPMGGNNPASVMSTHMSNSAQMQHSVAVAVHQQQQKSQSSLQSGSNNRNSADQTSFSAVLRNLAKQQDIKDDDMGQSGQQQQSHGENKSSSRVNEKEIESNRQVNASRSHPYDARGHTTIRHMSSPEPPEKKVKFFVVN